MNAVASKLRIRFSGCFVFREVWIMNRTANCLAAFLFAMTPLALGQEPQATPQVPEDALTFQQLIAWSRLQKPQPTPQPLPPPDTPVPQPDPQSQQAKPPASHPNPETPAQSFMGKIVKDGGKYVLKVTGSTAYQLDAQSEVTQYENQDVKIIGDLDSRNNTIHVVKIELLS
jgi:hypothetical protein